MLRVFLAEEMEDDLDDVYTTNAITDVTSVTRNERSSHSN